MRKGTHRNRDLPFAKQLLAGPPGPGLPGASPAPLASCPSVPASACPLPPLTSPPSVGCTALGFKGRPRGPSWRARAPANWPSSALSLFRSRPRGPCWPLPPSLRPSGAQSSALDWAPSALGHRAHSPLSVSPFLPWWLLSLPDPEPPARAGPSDPAARVDQEFQESPHFPRRA